MTAHEQLVLNRGHVALLDSDDLKAVIAAGGWYVRYSGASIYVARNIPLPNGKRTTQFLHTFLTGWPLVDHRNGDGLDNRRSNLRPATRSENARNRRPHRNNSSGFKGVSFHITKRRWGAAIKAGGLQQHLGYFPSSEATARAYDAAAVELHGAFARTNFSREDVSL